MQIAKIEIIAFGIACAVMLMLGIDAMLVGIYDGCRWHQHLTYQFFHANIFHLAVNLYVVWLCVTRFKLSQRQMLMCFIISAMVPATLPMPTIGASGIVYAMLGIINTMVAKKLRFAMWIAVYIAISALFNCNWSIHLCCYALGFMSNSINLLWTRLTRL